jgi:hypothetical protein
MNTNRDNLIKRLVDRKMASTATQKIGCVPCFGRIPKDKTSGAPAASATK